MSDQSPPVDGNRLPAEDLANEDRAEFDREKPGTPLESDDLGPDDWDGIDTSLGETVSLDALRDGEGAANDNWEDDDDNPFNDSDDALPDDGEEAALRQDLLDSPERGRFGDGE